MDRISIVSSPQGAAGVEYEVANGASVPNVGERRLDAVTINSPDLLKRIHMEVADVHKCLLSVSKGADMGYICILTKTRSPCGRVDQRRDTHRALRESV